MWPTYSTAEGGWWGISAGDSPDGYVAPGPVPGAAKGVVWPTAALTAVAWLATEIHSDLPRWKASRAWNEVSGPYGLAPFRLGRKWVGTELIGIDLGSFAVSLANYRNHTVTRLWMGHPVAQAAFRRLGYSQKAGSP